MLSVTAALYHLEPTNTTIWWCSMTALDRAKAQADLPAVVMHYYPAASVRGDRCKAPWRGGDDYTVSFHKVNGVWLWHDHKTNEGGTIVDWLMVALGYTLEQAIQEVLELGGESTTSAHQPTRAAFATRATPTPQPKPVPTYTAIPAADLARLEAAQKYLLALAEIPDQLGNRGFDFAMCKQYSLGATPSGDVLISVFRDGVVMQIKTRHHANENRYSNVKGHGTPAWLCPDYHQRNAVLIVEGELNAMAAHHALLESGLGFAVQGVSGANGSPHLEQLHSKDVFVYADGDQAGLKAVQEWAALILEHGAAAVKLLEPLPDHDGKKQDFCNVLGSSGAEQLGAWLQNAIRQAQEYSAEIWDDPEPLDETLPKVKPIDPQLIPAPIRDFCLGNAHMLQMPLEYTAAPIFAVIGSLIGRACRVQPFQNHDWRLVANLWVLLIAPSGMAKTPTMQTALEPLHSFESMSRKEAAAQQTEANLERELLEVELSTVKTQAKKEKNGVSEATRAKFRDLSAQITEQEKIQPKRYIVTDATDPSLCGLLQHNPRGLLIFRDEAAGWLNKLEAEHYSPQLYLELWNGNARLAVDRKSAESAYVSGGCISVLGGIQPAKLREYVADAFKGGASDGFLPRFQIPFWADSFDPWQWRDTAPNHAAKRGYTALLDKIDNVTPDDWQRWGAKIDSHYSSDEIDPYSPEAAPYFVLSPEAYRVFEEYITSVMQRVTRDDIGNPLDEYRAKMQKLFASLCLIFHVIEVASDESKAGDITESSAARAAAWCENLEQHHAKVIGLARQTAPHAMLATKIKKGEVTDGMPVRELERKQWSGLRTSAQVQTALAELEAMQWVKILNVATGGRPKQIIVLNPKLEAQNE